VFPGPAPNGGQATSATRSDDDQVFSRAFPTPFLLPGGVEWERGASHYFPAAARCFARPS
jgi:hypothetical protein